MKKFLVLAAAASLSASSALANAGDFYAKGTAGYAKFNNENLKVKGTNFSVKSKAKTGGATFGIGAGYYITDSVRADLMLEHFSNVNHKGSKTDASGDKIEMKLKSRATAAMVNGYVDFADVSDIKFFVGAGVGAVKATAKSTISKKDAVTGAVNTNNIKYKTENALAYALHLGATTQVMDKVNVELGYSWRNLGSVRDKAIADLSFPYRGHHVALGIRYDI